MSGSWTSKPLGRIVTLQRGFDLPKRQRMEGDVPIISSSGPEDFHNEPIKVGPGLITGRYGTIGKVFFVEGPYWPLNTTLFVSNFHGNDPRFCYYLLQRFDFVEHSGKTGVPGVNRNDLHSIEVLAPDSFREQQAIAAALVDADGVVAGLERLIAKKRLIKQGATQDLLTARRRLPGCSGDWEVKRLGDIARFGKGKGLPKSDVLAAGPFECIHYGSLFREQPTRITTIGAFTNGFDGAVYSEWGDVLMPASDVTPSGLAVASCIEKSGVILGGDILIIRPEKSELNGHFLSLLIRNSKHQILELVSGTTVFHIYAGDMSKFAFNAPAVDEQEAIVAVLSDMDAEIQTLEARLAKARAVKEGMMQNLLTGRVRLV